MIKKVKCFPITKMPVETQSQHTKTRRVGFGNYMCEEARGLIDGLAGQARGLPIGGTHPVFLGTQEGWQNRVNFLLGSRGQRVNWNKVNNPENRYPPKEVGIEVYAKRTSFTNCSLYQNITLPTPKE
ncbi:hypothetical protein ACFL0Y_04435 [Patescibacteria group bacterium]